MSITESTHSIYWEQMVQEERANHFNQVGKRLIEHRYRYYVLDHPVLTDSEYDFVERYYRFLASELNLPDSAVDMVDFDHKREDCQKAKDRVDTDTDSYSVWFNEMKPIWKVLGLTRKERNKEKNKSP